MKCGRSSSRTVRAEAMAFVWAETSQSPGKGREWPFPLDSQAQVPASRKVLGQCWCAPCLEVRAGKLTAGPRRTSEAQAVGKPETPARVLAQRVQVRGWVQVVKARGACKNFKSQRNGMQERSIVSWRRRKWAWT